MMGVFVRFAVAAVLVAGLSGCTGISYYAQSVNGHLEMLSARQPVAKLVDDPSQPAELRAEMALASDIRRYATDELALPDNASYRSYVDTGRDAVTWAVFAAPEFSLVPQTWCFPVFGCVPYRGYFSREAAIEFAKDVRDEGMDVHVTGITAYSTLGWFSDPLLNTMFRRDEAFLAALVFHELAHQRFYVRNDTAFNEAFAVTVETSGVRKWLKDRGDAAALGRYEAELKREADFLDLIAETRTELIGIYRGADSAAEKRAAKAAAIDRLRARYRRLRDGRWGGYAGYDGWFDAPINNAKLAATAVYNDLVPAFVDLFEACSGDYPKFYEAVRRIGALDKTKRLAALKAARRCET
jgi:predicted aminopeptidase